MSTLSNVCPACGAEESLDALLMRMIDDDQVRRLIADVITASLPVGGLVVRYLRLHKPPKQVLRMTRVAAILAELVPDVKRGAISRKGRDWTVPLDTWRDALAAVFDAASKGVLTLPLQGNGYLYEVVMRMADQAERDAEKQREQERRQRSVAGPRDPGAQPLQQAVQQLVAPAQAEQVPVAASVARTSGPSRAALRIQAEIAAARQARGGAEPAADEVQPSE